MAAGNRHGATAKHLKFSLGDRNQSTRSASRTSLTRARTLGATEPAMLSDHRSEFRGAVRSPLYHDVSVRVGISSRNPGIRTVPYRSPCTESTTVAWNPHIHPQTLGDFEIIREIGRGGMGVVYEARQKSLNRRVALKVLSSGLGLTAKAVMRFRREAEAAAKLHHTNIVPIYATGEEHGIHFYAMELIDGPSLDRVIRHMRAGDAGMPTDAGTGFDRRLASTR